MHPWDPEQQAEYTADVRDLAAGAFVVDEARHIVAWNASAEQLLGCSASEAIGQKCYEVLAFCDGRRERFCASRCPSSRNGRGAGAAIEFLAKPARGAVRRLTLATFEARSTTGRERIVHILLDPNERRPMLQELVAVGGGSNERGGIHPERSALTGPVEPAHIPRLSTRELEVLGFLAQGHAPGDIADALGISRVTVRNHITHVMEKLEVKSRLQAIVVASRMQLI